MTNDRPNGRGEDARDGASGLLPRETMCGGTTIATTTQQFSCNYRSERQGLEGRVSAGLQDRAVSRRYCVLDS